VTPAPAGERVALVSGGSRGLGKELVVRLLRDGWKVATFSRSANEFVKDTTAGYPDSFHWEAADLGDTGAVREFARSAIRRFGRVDLLVNNAGVLDRGLFVTMPAERVEALIRCNLTSPAALTQVCARSMVAGGRGGQIVNISSINAVRGYRGVAAYSAAKAGADGLTPALARELGPAGVRVNSIVPGFFDSDMTTGVSDAHRETIRRRTPLGRLGAIEDVAGAVEYLISPAAAFITGQTLIIDGGISC
jgi:3-oxoacyl-[acyl-carrier protein] reductase